MNCDAIKAFVTYYLQGLSERTRREKTGTKWGIDWVVYNIGLVRFGKPVRLPFLRAGDGGFPKSKVEAEFGVDLAFISEDGLHLSIFVLKDEPLTNASWTRDNFDHDLRMAMAPDLRADGLDKVGAVTVILVYNKDDHQNGIELYNRFVGAAPQTLRTDIRLQFRRWNLSELVEQTLGSALTPALLPERFFGQLSYIAAQAADFLHGSDAWTQQLVPNWQQFIDDVLSETAGVRGPTLIPVALIILRKQAEANKSIETGWLDLIEWAAIGLWRFSVVRQNGDIDSAVARFWSEFYIPELDRFYRAYIHDLATEQAVDQVALGSLIGTITAAYITYWHIGRLGILGISRAEGSPREDASGLASIDELGNWAAMLMASSPAVFRPLLDIQHIEFFLLAEVFRLAERRHEFVELIVELVGRLYLRRLGHSDLPFLDGLNSLENVFEQVASKPAQSLLLTESSAFVLMVLELCCLMPDEVRDEVICAVHRRLVLGAFDTGPPGDQKPLHLMSWQPPDDWATGVFFAGREGGQSVAAPPFAERDGTAEEIRSGMLQLVTSMRATGGPFRIPKGIPLGAMVLASLRYHKPLPPELWRRWAFPPEAPTTGELPG